MKVKTPETWEEAQELRKRAEALYKLLVKAVGRASSLKVRNRIAESYVRTLDAILEYRRKRSQNER